jgi:hypothetical protein
MMNTRRARIEARLRALEERFACKRQPPRPSFWARYWSDPVPTLSDIFQTIEPMSKSPEEIWARIEARLPSVSEEFRNMRPEQMHDAYRQEIARQKAT